jgi:hypothetical protein
MRECFIIPIIVAAVVGSVCGIAFLLYLYSVFVL